MVDKDKPKINLNLTDLDTEVKPEPYVVMTRQNKRVTFPDIFDMPDEQGEEFLLDFSNDTPDSIVLKKWLSTEDYEALREHGLTLRQRSSMIHQVMEYYQGTFGDEGEENASES